MSAKHYDVVNVGLQCIDIVAKNVPFDLMRGDTVNTDGIQLLLGGDALNQSIVLSKLGASVGLAGLVGNDPLGDILLGQLKNYKIDVFDRRTDVNTSITLVLIDEAGERHFLHQPGSNLAFRYEHIDWDAVKNSTFMSMGGCLLLPALCGDSLKRILEQAHACGARTAIDFTIGGPVSKSDIDGILTMADYILPSEFEAQAITGEREDPVRMAEALRDMGARNVIIKLGERGCYVAAEGFAGAISTYPCKCIDTTGAGDTFVAAFLYAKTRGWDIERCARFACAAGSVAVEHFGANTGVQSARQVLARMGN